MKMSVFLDLVIAVGFFAVSGLSRAQFIVQELPTADRIEGVDTIFLQRFVDEAGDMIEEKGEAVFVEFQKPRSKWNDGAPDLFVVNATREHENEGMFVVYPDPRFVTAGGLKMNTVNGRPLIEHSSVMERAGELGLIPVSAQPIPHAVKIVRSPEGRIFTLASGQHNLSLQAHFIHLLVDSACRLMEQEGEKAFETLAQKGSIYRFQDTYIFVQTAGQKIIFCPGAPDLLGKKLAETGILVASSPDLPGALKDYWNEDLPPTVEQSAKKLKQILVQNGSAWGVYRVPRPEETKPSAKASYFRLIQAKGKKYIVGCGVYLADVRMDIK